MELEISTVELWEGLSPVICSCIPSKLVPQACRLTKCAFSKEGFSVDEEDGCDGNSCLMVEMELQNFSFFIHLVINIVEDIFKHLCYLSNNWYQLTDNLLFAKLCTELL